MADFAQVYRSYVGVGVQGAALTTSVAATAFQSIDACSVRENSPGRKLIKGIRKNQDMNLALRGSRDVSGSISGPLVPDEMFDGILWALLLGNNNAASGSSGAGYTHTFSQARPATVADYPAYGATLEALIGGTDTTLMRDFVGSFVKSVTISGQKDGEVKVSVEIMGVKEVTGGTVSTPTYSTKLPFEAYMADIKLGSVIGSVSSVECKSFTIKIDNGLKMVPGLNGRYAIGRTYGPITTSFEFEMDLREDLTVYNYWKNDTTMAAQLVLTHDQLAGSSSGVYSLKIDFPTVIFDGDVPNIEGEAEIPHKVSMKPFYDSVTGKTLSVVVVNSQSGTYSV